MSVRKYRSVEEMPGAALHPPLDPRNLQLACDLSAAVIRLAPRRFPPGVHRYRSTAEARACRDQWEKHPTVPREWLDDFEAAARRPLETRFRYAFIRTYKPVLDDAPYRAFETMAAYRRWCEESLPAWLGYGRV